MKNSIKYNFYNVINFFDKKKVTYLFLSLILFNIYCIIDTKRIYGIDYNLIFDFNNRYYISMQLLLTTFFALSFINDFKSKIELITRFSDKRQYFNYIVKCIIFITTLIFLLNFGILFILRIFKHYFSISSNVFYMYNIPTPIYFIWQFFRNYVYILLVNYIIALLNFHISNKSVIYVLFGIIVVLLFIPIGSYVESNTVKVLFFSTFLSYYDFKSILNEISYFVCSFIIKFYAVYMFVFIMNKWKTYGKD